MKEIKSMNQELILERDEIEEMIVELSAREEYACTAEGCVGQGCGIN